MDRRTIALASLFTTAVGLLTGCGNDKGYDRLVPAEAKARQALQLELDAWKKGEQPTQRELGKTALHMFDSKWQAGQKLESYEILEEEPVQGTAPRWFKVRLTMKPSGQVKTRYAVLGDNPLQVFREEDYTKLQAKGM